ncbi:NADH:flavin oxidoreductase [Paludisphaera sp.]|uniref:NADH:flavin oxidoreductase n=1 Tax=Paludisphaera sp. TaxID=2017432 RepID=UPI00301CDF52
MTDGDGRSAWDSIGEPLAFPRSGLTVKNRIFRSSISGSFDSYDGTGGYARINWEEKFARGGVGAIISSFVPVARRGRILPSYAMIHDDSTIPFWGAVADRVHAHGCKFIIQLSHSGRQQDVPGVENRYRVALSSTSDMDTFHGLLCRSMTKGEIDEVVEQFGLAARRAQRAGLDGVETHSSHGYLINQFLSSGINDRTDEYGGPLENRARLLREIVRSIRAHTDGHFHLQCKISAVDYNNAIYPWEKKGNVLEDSVRVCQWLEEDGVDALHVSTGSIFPHPRSPAGDFPIDVASEVYGRMLYSGVRGGFNQRVFSARLGIAPRLFRWWWRRRRGPIIEGINAAHCAEIKAHVSIPVLLNGGIQRASLAARVIREGIADGVTIARPLIANNDLPKHWEAGLDQPPRPCTFCNKCLLNALANPLGCYELSRYAHDYDAMMDEVMSVFHPSPHEAANL